MESLFYAAAAIVLGWFGWRKRSDLASFVKTLIANVSTPAPRPPPSPSGPPPSKGGQSTTRPLASPAAGDVTETGETVVVQRGTFGSIICVSGVLLGKRWDIPGHGLSIGRNPDSDIVVDDSRVSATHAQIRPKQGEVVVVDAESKNGVYLNDAQHRVAGEAALKPGDVVMLSSSDAAHFIYRK